MSEQPPDAGGGPAPVTPSPKTLVAAMKAGLRTGGDLLDARIEEAFLRVPRAAFLGDLPLEQVYADEAIPVKNDTIGVISSSSQPSMMAIMLRMLRLRPGQNVLEIGTATGYNAALLQTLIGPGGHVTSVEIDPQMAEAARDNLQRVTMAGDIHVVAADGAAGFAPRASYDRIISTVGMYDVPVAWVRQLKPGGIIVVPLWLEAQQVCAAFHLQPDGSLYSERNLACRFIRMRGAAAGNEITTRVGGGDLIMDYTTPPLIDPAGLHALLSDGGEYNPLGGNFSYWEILSGWLPFLSLNPKEGLTVASYETAPDRKPYGIDERGLALIGRGTAAFTWASSIGLGFGSADAFLAMQDSFAAWDQQGRPRLTNLRLRLTPLGASDPRAPQGRHWQRRDHALSAWME